MKNMLILMFSALFVLNIAAKELKVLMIGNSFSQSVLVYLPRIVKAERRHSLLLAQLMIGGCSLEHHVKMLKRSEADPSWKPYRTNYQKRKKVSLPEMIVAEKWDIVTIQQASVLSWDKRKTQPFADELIAYIRIRAPQAEILVHQTWACRVDQAPEEQNLDRRYTLLTENYTTLARKHHLRMIPVGKAVQLFRKKENIDLKILSKADLEHYVFPSLPPDSGDLITRYKWRTDSGTGKRKLVIDNGHLNNRGAYLQACVWYGFLFGENCTNISYTPPGIPPRTAALLRTYAQDALTAERNTGDLTTSATSSSRKPDDP